MPFLKSPGIFARRSRKLEEAAKSNGLRHTIVSPLYDYYKGHWKNSVKDGWGVYLTRSAVKYSGDFEKNFRDGVGVLADRKPNKTFRLIYRGDWKRGYRSGYGAMHYPDGGYCEGYWKNGKRHGYAQMWYGDGSYYDGDFYKDLRHGSGLFVYPNGNRYEGEWANDLKDGKGRFYHLRTGQMQEGVWREDYCLFSTMIDIPYRQSSKLPTPYPIIPIQVVDVDSVCEEREKNVLDHKSRSCLKLEESY